MAAEQSAASGGARADQGRRPAALTVALTAALALVLASAACGALPSAGTPTDAAATEEGGRLEGTRGAVDAREVARRIHERVNAERATAGLPALAWQPGLVAAAEGHSADMARRDYFAHQSPEGGTFLQRYEAAGFRCRVPIEPGRFATGGENIAQTHLYEGVRVDGAGRRTPFGWRSADQIAARVVAGWMQSPGHRENILRPYWLSQAIGVVVDGKGRVFATQNFC